MTNVNTYQIAKDYAESIMAEREYWDVDQLWDICAEHAEGSQHVIYYSKAHDYVRSLPSDIQNDAENQVEDCGVAKSYDDYATKIAYFALQATIMNEVLELLEAVEECEA